MKKVTIIILIATTLCSCSLIESVLGFSEIEKTIPTSVTTSTKEFNKIYINWNDNYDYNITSFNIYRSNSELATFECIATVNSSQLYYIDENLSNGSIYYYYIKNVYEDGEGEKSSTVKGISYFKSPNLTVTEGYTELTFEWSPLEGADYYNLYTYNYFSEPNEKLLKEKITETTFKIIPTNRYDKYFLTAVIGEIEGNKSENVDGALSLLSKPEVLDITPGYTDMKLSWSEVDGADYYKVFHSDESYGDYTEIETELTTTEFVHLYPNIKKRNFYRVQACLDNGETSSYAENYSVTKEIPQPINIVGTDINREICTLTWESDVENANFNIYRGTNSNPNYSELLESNITVKTYTDDTSLLNTGNYKYFVKAILNTKESEYSLVHEYKHLAQEEITSITSLNNEPKICWDKNKKLVGSKINIYRSTTPNGEYTKIGEAESNIGYFTDNTISTIGTYYYKISRYLDSIESLKSDSTEVEVLGLTYDVIASNGSLINSIKVSWSENKFADSYKIYYSSSIDGEFNYIGETEELYYNHSILDKGVDGFYQISGVTSGGSELIPSSVAIGSTYGKKPSLTVTPAVYNEGYIISINIIPGAKSYRVFILNNDIINGGQIIGYLSPIGSDKNYLTLSEASESYNYSNKEFRTLLKVVGYFNEDGTGLETIHSDEYIAW